MDFELSSEQRDLQDGIRSLLAGRLPLSATRALEGHADTVDQAVWSELADAGVFTLLVPEADGGVGLGLAEATIVFEELGRVLATGPLVSTTALAPLLGVAGSAIPRGLVEAPRLQSATPTLIEHPASISALVVLPPVEDSAGAVTMIDRQAIALNAVASPLDPLTPLATIVGPMPAGEEITEANGHHLRQTSMVLAAAFQVGIAAEVVELARSYALGREQFGRPIGGFQAIKHLLADAFARTELARCAVQAAGVTMDDPQVAASEGDTMGLSAVEVRWRAVAGAKLLADEAAITNARTAIQVHGGMGFTWEVPVHLYLKRARVLASSFGTRTQLADMLASLL